VKNRIIYNDNSTLVNYTEELNNNHSGETAITFVAAEDALFIGTTLPCNHLCFKMGATPNIVASIMTVSIWDGSDFNAVAELVDGTAAAGATLGQSGFIEFTPDKQKGWGYDDTVDASGTEVVTGLGNVTIYDKYWHKITASADLSAALTIAWIGQIFSNDDDLGSEYPDLVLSGTMTAIEAGKTDYQEQAIRAAKVIIQDLKRKNVIYNKNQIIVRDDLMMTSVSKTAEIIYGMLGEDYNDAKAAARKEYTERLSNAFPVVDKNKNAIPDRQEQKPFSGNLIR